jgi:hypothetical protein
MLSAKNLENFFLTSATCAKVIYKVIILPSTKFSRKMIIFYRSVDFKNETRSA